MKTIGISISLFCYLALSSIHLVFCYQEKEKYRTATKPFLLLSLGICMCFYCPEYPLVPIACFLACFGDIFLIFNKKHILFLLGAIFFGASHILNILSQIKALPITLLPWQYVLLFLPVPLSGLIGYFFIEKHKPFSLFKYAFSMLHILNVIFSIVMMAYGKLACGMMIFFGYLFCIISDIILDKTTHVQDFAKRDFPIMLFYLVGQLLTYFGLAFALLSVF